MVSDTLDDSEPFDANAPALLQPDNHNKKYETLFLEIDSGQIKLPMFQRDFVWDKEQSAKLIDSIVRGYPIGTFIFWKTREELRSYKEIGNHRLPEIPKGDYVQYILDGQQRVTSLYAIRKGIRLTKDGEEIDYKDIYINLNFDPSKDEQSVVTELIEGNDYVSVHDVLTKRMLALFKNRDAATCARIEEYRTRLTGYDFSSITIKDYPIDVACEVFTRINTGGRVLTVFEIMVAKTYDESKNFDLAEQFELLRDGSEEDRHSLSSAGFETIPAATIMQCVAGICVRAVRSKDILKINRSQFISCWGPMRSALFSAIDFVRSELKVPVSQLLPYPAILVPISYFFHLNRNKKVAHDQARLLEQFFYWVGLTNRYSASTESKIAEDFNKMDTILSGKMPTYPRSELTIDPKMIAETWFSAGNAYCKAIIALLASQEPRSLDTNGKVILDNSNLKIATSKNYHHFFPRKYLADEQPKQEPNLIANITLMDAYSNKYRMGKRAPSDYISEFSDDNPKINASLRTHLIGDSEQFGITSDNYDRFIAARSSEIASALNERLMADRAEHEAKQARGEG